MAHSMRRGVAMYALLSLLGSSRVGASTFGYNYTASPGCSGPTTLSGRSGTEYGSQHTPRSLRAAYAASCCAALPVVLSNARASTLVVQIAGPYCWGSYNSQCSGTEQSPINIAHASKAPESWHELHFTTSTCQSAYFFNTGHTWEVSTGTTCHGAHELDFNKVEYELESIVFRSPSEHTIGGAQYDGEVQLVHQTSAGAKLILSVLLREVDDESMRNSFLDFLWGLGTNRFTGAPNNVTGNWSTYANKSSGVYTSRAIDPYAEIVPSSPKYYAYTGSLTEPPCTEQVQWIVMSQIGRVSKLQLESFRASLAGVNGNVSNIGIPGQYGNSRPVRPLGSRSVYFFSGAPSDHSAHEAHEVDSGLIIHSALVPMQYFISSIGVIILAAGGLIFAAGLTRYFARVFYYWAFPTVKFVFIKTTLASMRFHFARTVVLVLEILVCADLLDTLTTPVHHQTWYLLGYISILVAIRTILSLHISTEIEELRTTKHTERSQHGVDNNLDSVHGQAHLGRPQPADPFRQHKSFDDSKGHSKHI